MTDQPSTTTVPTRIRRIQAWLDWLQDGFLVFIVLIVGTMAGAASFHHVHDWTMTNSPDRTGDWFGWANAVITELIPTAALMVIARRRRNGAPIGYPMFLLVVAVGLSLTAQLAVARFTVFGWMVSALPALAFFALSKLVFSKTRPTIPVPASAPATVAPAPSFDTAPATVRPAAKTTPAKKTPAKKPTTTSRRTPAKKTPAPAAPRTTPQPETASDRVPVAAIPASDTADLFPGARIIADAHRQATGEPITAGQLAVRMRLPSPIAERILDQLSTIDQTATAEPHNGTPITIGVPA